MAGATSNRRPSDDRHDRPRLSGGCGDVPYNVTTVGRRPRHIRFTRTAAARGVRQDADYS
ncbi:MAG: hypothetical protein K2F91_06045 [Muribaculaceae bacterium]|nr:hypothetical protein [Muribaculaceae bacterium]